MESGLKNLSSNATQDCVGAFEKLLKATVSFVMPVRPSVVSVRNNSATTGRILMEFDIWGSLKILSRKFKFH